MARSVDPRRIDKDRLPVGFGSNAQNAMTGCLRLGRNNGHFLAHKSVEQSGLPGIRAPDDGNGNRTS